MTGTTRGDRVPLARRHLALPLAADLPDRTIATVESNWKDTGRIWEYLDVNTGAGVGAAAQTG